MNNAENKFIKTVWSYYKSNARQLPWRHSEPDGSYDPYKIWLSEIMLQQTQVSRVQPKYEIFLSRYPDVNSLAASSLEDVLVLWSGLGYNRRAKYLHQTAKLLCEFHTFPNDRKILTSMPGIGDNTAGAIMAYAFNEPVVFIETNIRTVYIHHFFHDDKEVMDQSVLHKLEHTLDRKRPREWYWALMDYGTFLKGTVGNKSTQSKSHVKQSKFDGSKRQIRGKILRELIQGEKNLVNLEQKIADDRFRLVIDDLIAEQLISLKEGSVRLGSTEV